eukprot:2646860-Pyramimonas_sp.AAC.1
MTTLALQHGVEAARLLPPQSTSACWEGAVHMECAYPADDDYDLGTDSDTVSSDGSARLDWTDAQNMEHDEPKAERLFW